MLVMPSAEVARSRSRVLEEQNQVRADQEARNKNQEDQETQARERRGIRIGKKPAHMSFTSSPKACRTSSEQFGASSLLIAQSYDRRLKDLVTFLRRRHPYMPDAERQERAQTKARELVEQELARMEPPSRQHQQQQQQQQQQADWFAEYQTTYEESDGEERKYASGTQSRDHQAELDEMRRSSAAVNQRYERMQQQATEAQRL
jgi:hypothetical protein